jgi:hypothetical protein
LGFAECVLQEYVVLVAQVAVFIRECETYTFQDVIVEAERWVDCVSSDGAGADHAVYPAGFRVDFPVYCDALAADGMETHSELKKRARPKVECGLGFVEDAGHGFVLVWWWGFGA